MNNGFEAVFKFKIKNHPYLMLKSGGFLKIECRVMTHFIAKVS